jgi:hypothetical protein
METLSCDCARTIAFHLSRTELLLLRTISCQWHDDFSAIIDGHPECMNVVINRKKSVQVSEIATAACDTQKRGIILTSSAIEARARIFGRACRSLGCCGLRTVRESQALQTFVAFTAGRLTALDLNHCRINNSVLLRLCELAPSLLKLSARHNTMVKMVPDVWDDEVQEWRTPPYSLARALSMRCPLLQEVELNVSVRVGETICGLPFTKETAVSHARHFVNLRSSDDVSPNVAACRSVWQRLVHLHDIDASGRIFTAGASSLCAVLEPIASRLTALQLSEASFTGVDLIAVTRVSTSLRRLDISSLDSFSWMDDSTQELLTPADLASICAARPELTALKVEGAFDLHDDAIEAICSLPALRVLSFGSTSEDAKITDRSLDAIARGLSSTLASLEIICCVPSLSGLAVERTVLTCSQLTYLRWEWWGECNCDETEHDRIVELVESRGGGVVTAEGMDGTFYLTHPSLLPENGIRKWRSDGDYEW